MHKLNSSLSIRCKVNDTERTLTFVEIPTMFHREVCFLHIYYILVDNVPLQLLRFLNRPYVADQEYKYIVIKYCVLDKYMVTNIIVR